ncbi:MAG TPA: methyltransferase [Candidatus Nanoarchaeia archaeon]|nr:methyltransferase [Candidatus Nanoarchaeia archaeon]
MQIFLLVFLFVFIVYFVVKALVFYKKFNINPMAFVSSNNSYEFFSWMFLVAVLAAYVVVIVMFSLGVNLGMIFDFLDYIYSEISGIIILLFGFFVMAVAHFNMGKEWRMGLDKNRNINLVTSGLFGISRNPVYVGIIIQAFGVFLIIKSLVSLVLLILLLIAFVLVIYTEERFLEDKFGREYLSYKNKVRRFL